MILQSDFPPDIRVEKEAKALTATGRYDVTVCCANRTGGSKPEVHQGIRIRRLGYRRYLGRRLNGVLQYPLWFNPTWITHCFLTAVRCRPAFIHVHDLPLMFLGMILARLLKARLVYDLHENYPATFDVWHKSGYFERIVRNKRLAEWYDCLSLKKADGVIVVEREHAEWIRSCYAIDRPMTVVSNTVDVEVYARALRRGKPLISDEKRYILSYVGKISEERDLDIALEAMSILRDEIAGSQLIIVGDGPWREKLIQQAARLGLQDDVEFTGWVSFDQTAAYIKASHVCLIPQGSNDLIDNGTPHKLYQYMYLGKPVVCSDGKAMKRVVTESRCGEVFRSRDPRSLADAVLRVKRATVKYGQNGRNAVEKKYNWGISSKELLELYDNLIPRMAPSAQHS